MLRTRSFRRGLEVVARIGEAAEEAGHHPDILLTYGRVRVTLTSHDAGGVTERDARLARAVSAIATELGIEPERQA
ncbi:4a-hydroxytetrahydrobiopterin dehydratase [Agrococcus terreus]|uniref:4a-hydroxytetrahydrobiopterin dehydratase n=1 Tax=Agrococcus terreus TaxID=574649 RepID=UPI00384E9EB2